jgi:cardiolipin synthase
VLPDVRSRPRDACERRTAVSFEAVESPGRLDATGPLDPRLQARLTQVSGRPLTRTNRVRLLRDGADTFTAMLEMIEHAETEVLLENYIIRADAVGRAYGEALTTQSAGRRGRPHPPQSIRRSAQPAATSHAVLGVARAVEYP